MKILIILAVLVIFFFILDYIIHRINLKKIKEKFPNNIIPDLDESIKLPIINNKVLNKTIYRTYYDKKLIPLFQKAIDTTQKNMTNYKQEIYDDDEIEAFIKEKFDIRIYNAYKSLNPVYGPARADFFRILIIYYYGGIYLDIKSAIIKNIEKLIENNQDKLLVSKGRNSFLNYPNNFGIIPSLNNTYDWSDFSGIKYGEYNNWHIIAPAGHPILGKVIKQIVSNIEYGKKNKDIYNYGEYSVLVLTGPIMYTKIIEKYKNKDIVIFEPRLNDNVTYHLEDHRKKGTKKHYSKNKEKNILI